MMRGLFKILFGGLLLLLLANCDNALDLEPTDILVEESVFADIKTAETALADAYNKLFIAATGDAYVIADFSVSQVGFKEGSPFPNYYSGNLDANDNGVAQIWQKCYEAINVANVFIDKIPKFAKYDEGVQRQHIAEAKFVRAYAYHILLNYFGHGALTGKMDDLGVPLQLSPYEGFNPSDLIPRSTNGEVYDQIINDLTEARADLPESYDSQLTTRVRATKGAVDALLSRIYLYTRDYEACIDASDRVLQNTNYQFDSSLLDVFPLNQDGVTSSFSNGVIFGFPVSSNGGNFQFGTHGIRYYHKTYWAADDFIESMDSSDVRRTDLIYEGNPNDSDPITRNKKTTFKFNNPDLRDDIKVMRLAEVMLNKAEALTNIEGPNAESIALLNEIKERANIATVSLSDFSDKEDLLKEIYHERYIETAFEGRGRFDFIRTGRPLGDDATLTEDEEVFPIPQREVDLSNNVLKQNPGY